MVLSFVVTCNMTVPQTRRDNLIEQLSSQGNGLNIAAVIFAMAWGFGYGSLLRFPDAELPDFYPIFMLLTSWFGVFIFTFLGMMSKKFRQPLIDALVRDACPL